MFWQACLDKLDTNNNQANQRKRRSYLSEGETVVGQVDNLSYDSQLTEGLAGDLRPHSAGSESHARRDQTF